MSDRYLESFLAKSSDAIMSLDHESTSLYCNASAGQLFDLSLTAMLGQHVTVLPCCTPVFAQLLQSIVRGEKVQADKYDCMVGSNVVPVEEVFSCVSDVGGTILGTTLTIRDISIRGR